MKLHTSKIEFLLFTLNLNEGALRHSLLNRPIMIYTILSVILIIALIAIIVLYVNLERTKTEAKQSNDTINYLLNGGTPTVKVQDIKEEDGLDIPEEDQEFLEPIIVGFLRQLVLTKVHTPTNAMLIDHLSDAIGMALEEYEPRGKSKKYQINNEGWLLVSAYAARLYMEGTPHDSSGTREQLMISAHFSKDNLHKWAKHMTDIITDGVRGQITGQRPGVKDVTEHIITASDGKYTRDEIEDMRKGLINKEFNGNKKL